MQRRKFIVVAGAATLTGLAGCSSGGDGGGGGSGGPEKPVEDFYDATKNNQDDPEAFVEEAEKTLHSESPLHGFLQFYLQAEGSGDAESSQTVPESIETEVASEDLSTDEIQSQFGGGGALSEVSEDLMSSLSDDNAVVETTAEMDDGSTQTDQWLVVKEDGEWVIFMAAGTSSSG